VAANFREAKTSRAWAIRSILHGLVIISLVSGSNLGMVKVLFNFNKYTNIILKKPVNYTEKELLRLMI
jgi:hypothetical protein